MRFAWSKFWNYTAELQTPNAKLWTFPKTLLGLLPDLYGGPSGPALAWGNLVRPGAPRVLGQGLLGQQEEEEEEEEEVVEEVEEEAGGGHASWRQVHCHGLSLRGSPAHK